MNGIANVDCHARAIKIAILTGASLAWNPRVFKEAMTLARARFDVVVLGSCSDWSGFEADQALAHSHGFRFESVNHISGIPLVNWVRSLRSRMRNRLGRDVFRVFGIENRWQLGRFVSDLLCKANTVNADYYIAHLEQAAWVGPRLLGMGKRVGIDFEDWYSEDLLPEARKQRPIQLLRDLERRLIQQSAHATCSSHAMSKALANTYEGLPPTVIYNSFPWADRSSLDHVLRDRKNRRLLSIHWYSQTISQGRGLEDLLAALPHLEHEAEIHLRGHPVEGFDAWLSARVPDAWRHRVFVHSVVANEQLLSRIAEHDIGFAGEMKYCRSRDLTITNKMLHYLLAGLAVVASDTAGQQEVAEQVPDAVLIYPSGDGRALAARLNLLLESPDRLKSAKAAALLAAEQIFCWERQEDALLETVMRAVSAPVSKLRAP